MHCYIDTKPVSLDIIAKQKQKQKKKRKKKKTVEEEMAFIEGFLFFSFLNIVGVDSICT